jgi:lipopolysaccharide/colanic/teichoic acid biosynthesis glycosyltransferase
MFDFVASGIGLIFLSPLFILIPLWIKIDSQGPVFFKQTRVGKNNTNFKLYKFRSMRKGNGKDGLITIGNKDSRVTKSGSYLRKYKLDEIPQLINVFIGDMSLVGPRPEVRKYVEMYTNEQLKVLSVHPGITDLASIHYRNENRLLSNTNDPEDYYVKIIMQDKLRINLDYVANRSFWLDIVLIFKTLFKIGR